MPPEMINKKSYDYKIDIWGLGILLYELTHGIILKYFFSVLASIVKYNIKIYFE
jgi:serine/threonine protein kinase